MKSTLLISTLALLIIPAPANTWPQFRGPHATGHADAAGLVTEWSETKNVKWKTPIPHKGWSTPLVSGTQVWLTAATAEGNDFFVLCLDRATGKVLHEAKLFHSDKPEPLGNPLNGYASCTGFLEDGLVYLHFGSYGTACLDTTTFKGVWQRTDLPCRHYRGPGSSLFPWKDTIILTMDGVDVQYLCALDKKTGKDRWRTDRKTEFDDLDAKGQPKREGDLRKSYSTPLPVTVEGKTQLVSSGSMATVGYDPDSGKELWRVRYKGFSNASIPAWHDGTLAVVTGHGKSNLLAFSITGQSSGDLTDKLLWEVTKNIPTRSSPVVVDGLAWVMNDNALISAIDMKTGAVVIDSERVLGSCSASPLYADGKLFFCTERGETVVVKPGRTFEKVSSNILPDGIMASPVAAGKELFIRTKTTLYCIAAP